jgi:hypothetical protein
MRRILMESIIETELRNILVDFQKVIEKAPQDSYGKMQFDYMRIVELRTRCMAAIERAVDKRSPYYIATTEVDGTTHQLFQLEHLIGIIKALHHDVQNGYLKKFEEIIHGEVFSDYLEMAEHLNDAGYKDAASVIAGSTLESHLRQLCIKASVPVNKENGEPKKADAMNSELVKIDVYSGLDQKNVTAWLGLRNHAAHGEYDKYNSDQVELMIRGIRDFITRNPA